MRRKRTDVGRQGFALATILIASTVMLMVLAASAVAASSIRTSLSAHNHTQLAREAAEAGAAYATACLASNANTAPWATAGRPLLPNTNCSGVVVGSSSPYVVSAPTLRTSFAVTSTSVISGRAQVTVTGKTELLRTSNQSVWRDYSVTFVRTESSGSLTY